MSLLSILNSQVFGSFTSSSDSSKMLYAATFRMHFDWLIDCQGCGEWADLLRHHQPGPLWRLPGVQLHRVGAHVCSALHGGHGVLRPHGPEASGARMGRTRGRERRSDGPAFQAEVGEDDHHCAGDVHALLPALPPHQESLLLLQIPAAGRSSPGGDTCALLNSQRDDFKRSLYVFILIRSAVVYWSPPASPTRSPDRWPAPTAVWTPSCTSWQGGKPAATSPRRTRHLRWKQVWTSP